MKTATQLMFAGSVLAAALCFYIPASKADLDAPWCAVFSAGMGGAIWDADIAQLKNAGRM